MYWQNLKESGPDYKEGKRQQRARNPRISTHDKNSNPFGQCPVASEKTVCCNLHTIDAVQNCVFGCSYCSIQSFYDPDKVAADINLKEKLMNLQLDPAKRYHIGSGQSSDSLALGNVHGVLDAQFEFARKNPNIILEFKTKAKNIAYLLETDVPENVFVSWSLNPQTVIENEEPGTANLEDRLKSARAVADKGVRVGFHFHPIIHYQGWEKSYQDLIERVGTSWLPEEIAFVSFGTLTFIKPAIKSIRKSGANSKILQLPLENAAGKLSYPFELKEQLFQNAWDAFTPWREQVFFYMCMEDRRLWDSVFGYCYETNDALETAMLDSLWKKLGLC